MEMRLSPKVESVSISRICPSGGLAIGGKVGFYSKGRLIASRAINETYGHALKLDMSNNSHLMDAASAFLTAMLDACVRALGEEMALADAEEAGSNE